ncbi:hypothetical protein CSN27_001888 [Salmonella enterica subsp. houtenae]|nr:hypothetical protein [Salmonella enterica subsp. VII str. CFSAN000550]EDU6368615.1 hypothetical protein [Salmonella enterica subsp. houtenae serovar 40:z4,z24:-]EDU7900252.1 hypothetical protein [Salmonella enterica subsp. houtenae]
MRRYHRKAAQSLANQCKALCVPFLSHIAYLSLSSAYPASLTPAISIDQ